MLCIESASTNSFKPLGQSKHIAIYTRYTFLINFTNQIEVCGYLVLEGVTINSQKKTFLEIPNGKLLDVSVNEFGANILMEILNVKSLFFIGKSYSDADDYYDIGVYNPDFAQNWTQITNVNV